MDDETGLREGLGSNLPMADPCFQHQAINCVTKQIKSLAPLLKQLPLRGVMVKPSHFLVESVGWQQCEMEFGLSQNQVQSKREGSAGYGSSSVPPAAVLSQHGLAFILTRRYPGCLGEPSRPESFPCLSLTLFLLFANSDPPPRVQLLSNFSSNFLSLNQIPATICSFPSVLLILHLHLIEITHSNTTGS